MSLEISPFVRRGPAGWWRKHFEEVFEDGVQRRVRRVVGKAQAAELISVVKTHVGLFRFSDPRCVRRIETDRDDLARFPDVAAEPAGTHLLVDDQTIGWVFARHIMVVGVDEGLVWGGV